MLTGEVAEALNLDLVMIEVEKRRTIEQRSEDDATNAISERTNFLTKKDGDRFHGGVVKDEIIDRNFERGGIEEGMSEPDGRLASCQTTGPGRVSG